MDFHDQLRAFTLLGGQNAPVASDGVGVRILYRCSLCQRIWLQDGRSTFLDLRPEQVQSLAKELAADLEHLPTTTCRVCLLRTGGGSVGIDEYDRGEGFGFCWEIPQPIVLHATSAILSQKGTITLTSQPDVLTRPEKLRAVLHAVKDAPPPHIASIDPTFCRLQSLTLRPGFGQAGTEQWQWQGWMFRLACPPLNGDAIVTLMLALPPAERLLNKTAFFTWQFLIKLTLLGALPEKA